MLVEWCLALEKRQPFLSVAHFINLIANLAVGDRVANQHPAIRIVIYQQDGDRFRRILVLLG